jgi:hypothetical protein
MNRKYLDHPVVQQVGFDFRMLGHANCFEVLKLGLLVEQIRELVEDE